MNDSEKTDAQFDVFDEKDIEQIFGGNSVLSNAGSSTNELQAVRQQEQETAASDNLS
ncbi:hypothetical protein [Phocaeicola plebeius]|uniref:hypothetical protein n=1 Tax=Phocaeicola plebeius TaxID=310297 RepID=UPI00356605AA